jgi:hypothetical protein
MAPTAQEVCYEGIRCDLRIERLSEGVVVLRISGTDVGEFGAAPMRTLNDWLDRSGKIDFFIDAREVRGASISVSAEWASWLNSHKEVLRTVTMIPGSRFVQMTAEFVRRFTSLEGVMKICREPGVFDQALAEALAA